MRLDATTLPLIHQNHKRQFPPQDTDKSKDSLRRWRTLFFIIKGSSIELGYLETCEIP